MGLGARRGLLPSRCAWLQPRSSLTAGAGVQQSPSSWQDRAKAQPLWHPHQNGCPDAGQPWGGCTRELSSVLAGTRSCPDCGLCIARATVAGEATGFQESSSVKQARTTFNPLFQSCTMI